MFNVGGGELIVIMLIALIVLGPKRLPDAARQIGKAMGDLRRLSTGFQNEVRTALHTEDDPDQVTARRNVLAKETPAAVVDPADPPTPTSAAPAHPRPSAQARAAAAQQASAAAVAPKKAAAKKAAPKTAGAKKKAAGRNGTPVKPAAAGTAKKKAAGQNGSSVKGAAKVTKAASRPTKA